MPEETDGVGLAVPPAVPLAADSVLGPRLAYGRYDHYLLRFRDQFVEAIALGIWLDKPRAANPLTRPNDHAILQLPEKTVTERSTSFGTEWERLLPPERHCFEERSDLPQRLTRPR